MSSEPRESFIHHCEQCGYELSGLGDLGTCPECGTAFIATIPFKIERIDWMMVAIRMSWPACIVGAGWLAVIDYGNSKGTGGIVAFVGFCAWTVLATFVPLNVAFDVARCRWTRPRRQVPIGLMFAAGPLLNLVGLAIAARVIGIR